MSIPDARTLLLTGLLSIAEALCIPARNPDVHPLMIERVGKAQPLYGEADTLTLTVIGDIMLHSRQMEYPYGPFLAGVSARLRESDFAIGNMEFTLAGEPYSGYPAFSAPDQYAEYAAECGIDVFLTANNHILDKGLRGLARTLDVYGEMEADGRIRFTGSAVDDEDKNRRYPLMLRKKGFNIALINFTYGTNVGGLSEDWPATFRMRREDIAAAIARAEEKMADFIIALPHWGNEYELRHSVSQMELAQWMVAGGVDAIVGSHPHVVQDSCVIGGSPVFFSIGNVVSNMSAPNTQIGMAVTLKFARDRKGDKKMLEPEVTYTWCSLPGRLSGNYTTVEVKDYLGCRDKWLNEADYYKMKRTYSYVRETTGVSD